MLVHRTAILVFLIATASCMLVAQGTSAVASGIAGVLRGRTTLLMIGSWPRKIDAAVPPDRQDDWIPEWMGRQVRWTSYTLDGRCTGEGIHVFAEQGGRRLLLTATETNGSGPRVVVCRSPTSPAIWRRLLWIVH